MVMEYSPDSHTPVRRLVPIHLSGFNVAALEMFYQLCVPILQAMKSVSQPIKSSTAVFQGRTHKAKQSSSDNETTSKMMLSSDKRNLLLHLSI